MATNMIQMILEAWTMDSGRIERCRYSPFGFRQWNHFNGRDDDGIAMAEKTERILSRSHDNVIILS